MSNALLNFLELYTFIDPARTYIDKIVFESDHKFENKTKECSTLALIIQKDFQEACLEMLAVESKDVSNEVKAEEKETIHRNLTSYVETSIDENTIIAPDAKITKEKVAKGIIDKVYQPMVTAGYNAMSDIKIVESIKETLARHSRKPA